MKYQFQVLTTTRVNRGVTHVPVSICKDKQLFRLSINGNNFKTYGVNFLLSPVDKPQLHWNKFKQNLLHVDGVTQAYWGTPVSLWSPRGDVIKGTIICSSYVLYPEGSQFQTDCLLIRTKGSAEPGSVVTTRHKALLGMNAVKLIGIVSASIEHEKVAAAKISRIQEVLGLEEKNWIHEQDLFDKVCISGVS